MGNCECDCDFVDSEYESKFIEMQKKGCTDILVETNYYSRSEEGFILTFVRKE